MNTTEKPKTPMLRNHCAGKVRQGFTLIELMIAMALGLILLLGMTMMFTSNVKVSSALAQRTERLADLYLVSQIMQSELRNAQGGTISWGTNVLAYTDQDGDTGQFEYQRTSNDRLYWQRPSYTKFEELIRDLDTATGMTVTSSGATTPKAWTVTLKSSYQDENRQTQTLDLSFSAWARN